MNVKLLKYTEDAERLIAQAAKLCYSKSGVDDISEKMSDEDVHSFISKLMVMNHESPIEHANFTFAVEGVSRTLTHQLVRHRIASFSQQSQRYVNLEQFEYIIPPQIEEDEETKKLYIEAMELDQKYYNKLVDILYNKNLQKLISSGVDEKKAEGQAEKMSIEDARYVFPNACETKIVFTMNTRALLHFFSLRCCERAQWEIKTMATEMLKKVKEVYPILFKNAGPGCVRGGCPEGAMTCGRPREIREYFRGL